MRLAPCADGGQRDGRAHLHRRSRGSLARDLALLIGATIGGYCGAQVGRRAPPQVIRAGTLFVAGCITCCFLRARYLKDVPW